MNYNKFKEKFNRLLVEKLSIEPERITPHARFTDLGVDSLDLAELTIDFEAEFSISIADYEANQIVTVLDAETFIKEKLAMTDHK